MKKRTVDREKVTRFLRRVLQDVLFAAGLGSLVLLIFGGEPTATLAVVCLIYAEVARGMKP